MEWIDGSIKKWNCEHVNKCWVLVVTPEEISEYLTDWPEPDQPYFYVFLTDISRETNIPLSSRDYIKCDCKKDDE